MDLSRPAVNVSDPKVFGLSSLVAAPRSPFFPSTEMHYAACRFWPVNNCPDRI